MIPLLYGQKLLVVNQQITDFSHKKEMGYSKSEFINQFKLFAKGLSYKSNYQINDTNIIILREARTQQFTKYDSELSITFLELADRKIGALSISCSSVTFQFKNYSQLQYQQFLKNFDLSFQRGGG